LPIPHGRGPGFSYPDWIPVLVGGVLLLAATADALVRVWRSVRAWWDVDRGRAWFRVVWTAVLAGSLVIEAAIMLIVLTA
jgi:hypothetical protein